MNLAQVTRLADLVREAQPALPLYHGDDEPVPTATVRVRYHNDDLEVCFFSQDTLAVYPAELYIDEDGVLYDFDHDALPEGQKVPCTVDWRYGQGGGSRDYRYSRYLDVHPVVVPAPVKAEAKS